jgi:hypothetical protein
MSYVMFVIASGMAALLGVCVGVELGSLRWGMAGFIVAQLLTIWIDALAGAKA